jgi:hypothetical protein
VFVDRRQKSKLVKAGDGRTWRRVRWNIRSEAGRGTANHSGCGALGPRTAVATRASASPFAAKIVG